MRHAQRVGTVLVELVVAMTRLRGVHCALAQTRAEK
jgi:hypothetical protein